MEKGEIEEKKKLFIEIFTTAHEPGGFQYQFGEEIGISFLKLIGTYNGVDEDLKAKYDGVSRVYFEKNSFLNKIDRQIDEMIDALSRIAKNVKPVNDEEFKITENHSEPIKTVYEFYRKSKGHDPEIPFRKHTLEEKDILLLATSLKEFGKKVVEYNVLTEISDHLKFVEFYSVMEKVIVDKTSDACWDLYNQITDYGKNPSNLNLTRDEFRERIFKQYHIRHYQHLSEKDARTKISNTVAQWTRDVRNTNQIHIKK